MKRRAFFSMKMGRNEAFFDEPPLIRIDPVLRHRYKPPSLLSNPICL